MKTKNTQDNLPDVEFSFPLEGVVIKAKTLEEAQAELIKRKEQSQQIISDQGEN